MGAAATDPERGTPVPALERWYRDFGRHDLPWRLTRDRWAVLVSEVMLQQTQVSRVLVAWPSFMERFPTPVSMAERPAGDVIEAWGRLGYPRRARRLWEAARMIAADGWPDDLTRLPGVGRYTVGALAAQADGEDVIGIDANIRRVVERVAGRRLAGRAAEQAAIEVAAPLQGRDRLLALMDVGALVCRPRRPECGSCPLEARCATRGPLDGETRSRQAAFEGSFRQRRGRVLAALRSGPQRLDGFTTSDVEALESLATDGLAEIDAAAGVARLPA